jgi:serine/threonine protein kinase
VQLYEAGEARGLPFFSLELCDGGTLGDQLRKQRPSSRDAAWLIETLARAVHYAHLRGVVHRDLKPANVLLAGAERLPKIADFGLAKRIDAEARGVSGSGAIVGTAWYMAPEQAAGKVHDTGPAADVYALGALLYECLLGEGKFADAEPLLRASLAVVERQNAEDWSTFCVRSLLGAALRGRKAYAEAEPLLLLGYEGLKRREARIPAASKRCLVEAADRLARLYGA